MCDFPTDPALRKAILVLSRHDYEKCEYDVKTAKFLNDDEIFVLPYPIILNENSSDALRKFVRCNAGARPGEMLVQSPFDTSEYASASLAAEKFALDKHMKVSLLCQLLGAKSFRLDQIDLRTGSSKATLTLKGAKSSASVGGSAELEKLETLKNQMSVDMMFSGSGPNILAAEELLDRTGLRSDPRLLALVEMRRDVSNPLLSQDIVVNLSSEVQSNLSVAARAKITDFVNITADAKQSLSVRKDYTVTTHVTF